MNLTGLKSHFRNRRGIPQDYLPAKWASGVRGTSGAPTVTMIRLGVLGVMRCRRSVFVRNIMDDEYYRDNPLRCLVERVLRRFRIENPRAVSQAVVEAVERSDYAIVPVGDWMDRVNFDE